MRFTFRHNSYYRWYHPQTESRYGQMGDFFSYEDFLRLKVILIKTFPSVVFSDHDTLEFRFDEQEDNDYFLVWSSDGIEV